MKHCSHPFRLSHLIFPPVSKSKSHHIRSNIIGAMVLDPLTAFSLAGTIVQFVDFSCKLLAKTKDIYDGEKDVTTKVNEQLRDLANDLLNVTTKLNRPLLRQDGTSEVLNPEEQQLQDLCKASAEIAQDMIDRLNALEPPPESHGSKRVWKSFQQAIQLAWSETEMTALSARLSSYREMIQMHIIVQLR